MKRQQAPKPEAQEPSDNPPLSEHSRGDRQTPAIIYRWPKKSGLYEMDPCVKKKAQKRLKNLTTLPEWPTLHEILTAVADIVWEADNVEEAKELALPGQQAIMLPIWSTIIANKS